MEASSGNRDELTASIRLGSKCMTKIGFKSKLDCYSSFSSEISVQPAWRSNEKEAESSCACFLSFPYTKQNKPQDLLGVEVPGRMTAYILAVAGQVDFSAELLELWGE